ncbi:uncharacterized protein MELLADRAFT_78634 [Melampsora larici-populina 98AG31]|uniref:FYVE-type domain-containing protein n=1 Tax=Melampsora larici-populina (strain 98AG31 / pathotype 3-4-7) TaxID=747676 RepID=F4RWQ3_MELLP|nr:uncharacterized protein MELLADRAFT_78634 [Melampsora larici-populina 98AG31]EGG03189.1 hypothetical protein MELLADRAFT_78634 [Melampsora larici-populina 98AG31]
MNTLPSSPTPTPSPLNYKTYTSKQQQHQLKSNSNHHSSSSLSTINSSSKDLNQRPSSLTSLPIIHHQFLDHSSSSSSSPHLNSIRQSNHHQHSRSINSINSNTSSPINSRPTTPALFHQATSSSSSSSKFSSLPPSHTQVPFRSGFQPKGVYRNRTDLLVSFRKGKEEIKRLEESRLQKRLERLIDLHFPNPSTSTSNSTSKDDHHTTATPLLNSFTSLTNHYLSGLIESTSTIRSKEQTIVRWQEDSEIKRCTICNSQFSVRVRKHHCRLCGKVICFLPIDEPIHGAGEEEKQTRKERCSSFIRFEWDSEELIKSRIMTNESNSGQEKSWNLNQDQHYQGRIIELNDEEIGMSADDRQSVFDMIHKKPDPNSVPQQNPLISKPKGVRVCRECLTIVLRRQSMTYPIDLPEYLKLYSILKQLQDEIERSLPEFQEMMINSKNPTSNLNPSKPLPPLQLMNMRKRLLRNLQSYDSTSKRLSHLTHPSNSNHSQNTSEERLKKAIITRSAFFLRDHMGLIRSIGGFDVIELPKSSSTGSTKHDKPFSVRSKALIPAERIESNTISKENEILPFNSNSNSIQTSLSNQTNQDFNQLNVLLEQERLVEGYLEEANSRRQLEDSVSLKISLDELREEIKVLKDKLKNH